MMTFEMACKLCYENFKKNHNVGIGKIQECADFWIFYKSSTEVDYGFLPIIVYKSDEHPVYMTFNLYLELSDILKIAKEKTVPVKYKN